MRNLPTGEAVASIEYLAVSVVVPAIEPDPVWPSFGGNQKGLFVCRVEPSISSYITGNNPEASVGTSQKRAIQNYRTRLGERGLTRFEVLGRDGDRDLIRSLARRLAEDGPDAARLRVAVAQTISGEPPKIGGILAALRRSPLVGADLDLSRPHVAGRKIDL